MLDRTFKFVYVSYKDGLPKPNDAFTLVTDIQYYNDYIVIEYYKKPDKVSSTIIMTAHIGGIAVEELDKYDAERDWVKMNNAVCGNNFTQIKFWPYEGKKSSVIIDLPRKDGYRLEYHKVIDIDRKWNHDTRSNEIWIRTIDNESPYLFNGIDHIFVINEEDIKTMTIQRTDHEDLVINVNGGTYRND